MTELEWARTHLRNCQWSLKEMRRHADTLGGCGGTTISHAENHVLAALSWVWEMQQRYLFQEEQKFIDEMIQAGADVGGPALSLAVQARRDALLKMNKYAFA